jgi:hypothetical protein
MSPSFTPALSPVISPPIHPALSPLNPPLRPALNPQIGPPITPTAKKATKNTVKEFCPDSLIPWPGTDTVLTNKNSRRFYCFNLLSDGGVPETSGSDIGFIQPRFNILRG